MRHHRTMNIIIDDGPYLISESIVIDLSVLISKIAHPPRSRTGALGLTRTCIRTGPCSNYWACTRLLHSKSCESVLPALLHLMFESGAESPTSEITECTPCLYLCKKCYGLLQRYSNLQNVLKVSTKQVIESGLVMSSSIIQPACTKRPRLYGHSVSYASSLSHHTKQNKDRDTSVSFFYALFCKNYYT